MNQTLTADDLLPLVLKLPRDEQKRLAQRILETVEGSSTSEAQPAHPFAGTYVDGQYRETVEGRVDNIIKHGTIGLEKGRRVLRLKGTDGYNQNETFTVEAFAQDVDSDVFTGKWWWDGETTKYALELKLYGDPTGKFALVGFYQDDEQKRKRYCWTLELHPPEE